MGNYIVVALLPFKRKRKMKKGKIKKKKIKMIPWWYNDTKEDWPDFTGRGNDRLLNKEDVLLYVVSQKDTKIGEVCKNLKGKTPRQAYFKSYESTNRSSLTPKGTTGHAFITINRRADRTKNYDNELRDFINTLHRLNPVKYPFFCPGNDGEGNKERIKNFNGSKKALSLLFEIVELWDKNSPIFQSEFSYRNLIQEEHVALAKTILRKDGRVLLAFFTAYGKTAIIAKLICDNCCKGSLALVSTPVSDTMNDCYDNMKGIWYGKDLHVITNKDFNEKTCKQIEKEIKAKRDAGYIVVILVSVQNLRYDDKKLTGKQKNALREKFAFLSKLKLKMWIRDEYHKEYNGLKTKEVFKNISAEYIVDMTASTYRLLDNYGLEYKKNQIIFFDYIDARNSGQFNKLPNVLLELFDLNAKDIPKIILDRYRGEDEYDPRKSYLMRNGKFEDEESLLEEYRLTYDGVYIKGVLHRPQRKNNSLAVYNDADISDSGVIFDVIPEGNDEYNTRVVQEYLADLLNERTERRVWYTAEYLKRSIGNGNVKLVIDKWIAEARAKGKDGICILTHRQFLTGTNIPRLAGIVLHDKVCSPDDFLQMTGRLFREYKGKKRAKMYIRCPGMELSVPSFKYRLIKDNPNIDEKKRKKMYNSNLPITTYNGKPTIITYEDGMNCYNEMMRRDMSNVSLSSFHNKFPEFVEETKDWIIDALGCGNTKHKASITPKTNAKVGKTIGRGKTKRTEKEQDKVIETLVAMIREIPAVGIIGDCEEVKEVPKQNLFKEYFSENNIRLFNHFISDAERYAALNDCYKARVDAYRNGKISNDDIFVNQAWKSKMGLVHMRKNLIEKMSNLI